MCFQFFRARVLLLLLSTSCAPAVSPQPTRVAPPSAPAPTAPASRPSSRPVANKPQARSLPAPNPTRRLRALLDQLSQKLARRQQLASRPLRVEVSMHGVSNVGSTEVRAELVSALRRAKLLVAPQRFRTDYVASLELCGRDEIAEGKRTRALAAALLLVARANGELLWLDVTQHTQAFAAAPAGSKPTHPTRAEMLELARHAGRELRKKLDTVPSPRARVPVVVEARPVRSSGGTPIDGQLASNAMLAELLVDRRIRAPRPPRADARGHLPTSPAASALTPTYVLRGELSHHGGGSSRERRGIRLEVSLAPLIATNAPSFDATAWLYPPIAPPD